MVAHLTLDLLHVGWRYLAIPGNVSGVPSKASVGLSKTIAARFDTQLLLYVEFVPVVVEPVVFADRKAV